VGIKVEMQNRAAAVLRQYVRRAAANHQHVSTRCAAAVIAAAVLAELQVLRLLALLVQKYKYCVRGQPQRDSSAVRRAARCSDYLLY